MKLGIVITVHNRADYTRECFDYIMRAALPDNAHIVVVDDSSTDPVIATLCREFNPSCALSFIRTQQKQGVKEAIKIGMSMLSGCDVFCILDNDAIVNNEAFNWMLHFHLKYQDTIVTGFNCNTRNANGSVRHHNVGASSCITFKKSVGGINMVFNDTVYKKYILPALNGPGNWDHEACKRLEKDGKKAAAITPSVVQHIGMKSSMGHNYQHPDVADDFRPLSLFDVTLVGVSGNDIDNLIAAANVSTTDIHFADVKLLSHVKHPNPWVKEIDPVMSKAAYNKYVLKELVNHIDTSHFLIIQSDGFVLNWKAWSDEFLQYDYIGALWPWYTDGHNCGNGGFSLRSKKLHEILRDDDKIIPMNDHLIKNFEEDHNICRLYRSYLEKEHGIRFAPDHICEQFSIEAYGVKPPGNKYAGSFGFHSTHVDFRGVRGQFIPYLTPGSKIRYA